MASQVAQWQRIHLPSRRPWVRSLGREDPLEKEMAAHPSILAGRIPRTEEASLAGWLQSMGLQRVRRDLATKQQQKQEKISRQGNLSVLFSLSQCPELHGVHRESPFIFVGGLSDEQMNSRGI